MRITYKKLFGGSESVFLDGKKVGTIHQTKAGWVYFPFGNKKQAGDPFDSVQEVKKSLEEP